MPKPLDPFRHPATGIPIPPRAATTKRRSVRRSTSRSRGPCSEPSATRPSVDGPRGFLLRASTEAVNGYFVVISGEVCADNAFLKQIDQIGKVFLPSWKACKMKYVCSCLYLVLHLLSSTSRVTHAVTYWPITACCLNLSRGKHSLAQRS